MAHFQLKDGTRLASKVHKDERIAIHLGQRVELYQAGGQDASGTMPTIKASKPGIVNITNVQKVSADLQKFTIEALVEEQLVLLGQDSAGKRIVDPLVVTAGRFQNHTTMVIDLLAEKLGQSSDPVKIHTLRRLLENDDTNLFDQFHQANVTRYGSPLACGRVVYDRWNDLKVGQANGWDNERYHRWLAGTPNTIQDVKYDQDRVERAQRKIRALLEKKIAVRVGVSLPLAATHMTVINGDLVAYHAGGHYVLIVGCNAASDEFLYVDPLPGASRLEYTGGIQILEKPGSHECNHLGIFHVHRNPAAVEGRRYFLRQRVSSGIVGTEVIRGPL
jgi:hypothetical protein